MKFLLRWPVVRTLHRWHLLFPAVVLLVVAAVLVEGTMNREADQPSVASSFVEPTPRPVQRAELEKTPLTYFSDYWNQLAEGARPNLIAIGASQTPALLIGSGLALTTLEPALEILEARDRARLIEPSEPEVERADPDLAGDDGVVTPDESAGSVPADGAGALSPEEADAEGVAFPQLEGSGSGGSYRLRSWNSEMGLALFDVAGSDETAFTLSDPRILPSGSYVGAVTLDTRGRPTITPGYLVTAESGPDGEELVVSMDFPDSLSVAAVVNLEGALVGVAYSAPGGPRVVTSTELLGLLDALQVDTRCRGIEVSNLSAEVRALLDVDSGVLVEFVDTAAFEPLASLRGGDVLVEWGGEAIESAEQFTSLYDSQEPGLLVSYRVIRAGRRVTGGVVMHALDCKPLGPDPVRLPRLGLAVNWVSERQAPASAGWRAIAVAENGTSAVAGVEEGDWLVEVNGQALEDEGDRSQLESLVDTADPVLLTLIRDGRTKMLAVHPTADVAETDAARAQVESAPPPAPGPEADR